MNKCAAAELSSESSTLFESRRTHIDYDDSLFRRFPVFVYVDNSEITGLSVAFVPNVRVDDAACREYASAELRSGFADNMTFDSGVGELLQICVLLIDRITFFAPIPTVGIFEDNLEHGLRHWEHQPFLYFRNRCSSSRENKKRS